MSTIKHVITGGFIMEDLEMYASQGASTSSVIFSLAFCVLSIVAMWKIFEKAGEPGWKSIIPIYDLYILFKIAWGKGILFLLLLIPVANIVVYFILYWKLAKSFDQSTGMCVLMLLFPQIVMLILGFGNSEYIGPQ